MPARPRRPFHKVSRGGVVPYGRWGRWRNGLWARHAGLWPVTATLRPPPAPQMTGDFAKGAALVAGRRPFGLPDGGTIWDGPLDRDSDALRHACLWLSDLGAVGDKPARGLMQAWVLEWIQRFGRGTGWRAGVTGERLLHWAENLAALQRGADPAAVARIAQSIARQTRYLSHAWKVAPQGMRRVQALVGLCQGALLLAGQEALAQRAVTHLAQALVAYVDPDGAIPTRNPEELCAILTLLVRLRRMAAVAQLPLPAAIEETVARITPTLRNLRMADGGLARFHGGGRGALGALDAALAESGHRKKRAGLAMGYARLSIGRSSLVMDAAPPPTGRFGGRAHAATLAFEFTSGRRPLIVNCGAAVGMGAEWQRGARATASQSTLEVAGLSSARLGGKGGAFSQAPDRVPCELSQTPASLRVGAAHNGWQGALGLTHARTLDLTLDGRALTGEDLLVALGERDKMRFAGYLAEHPKGAHWAIRFHLHPKVVARLDPTGKSVHLALLSGEKWVFHADGAEEIALKPSAYLESAGGRPRESTQVVLSGHAMAYATRVRWSLAKAQETPNALRDLGPDPTGEDEEEHIP